MRADLLVSVLTMDIASSFPLSGPTGRQRQGGATLVIALIFLIVLTLLVFSGVTSGVLSYRIAGNMQQQREAAAAAQAVIDARLGDASCFANPAGCAATDTIGAYSVALAVPRCLGIDSLQDPGKKSQYGVQPIPKYLWEFSATASNALTGTSVTVTQGVKMEMNVGSNCPN